MSLPNLLDSSVLLDNHYWPVINYHAGFVNVFLWRLLHYAGPTLVGKNQGQKEITEAFWAFLKVQNCNVENNDCDNVQIEMTELLFF